MDGSGSVAAVTDTSGNVIQTVTYSPSGAPIYTNVEPNVPSYPLSVDGVLCDTQTGLCSTGNGYYEPSTGQGTQLGAGGVASFMPNVIPDTESG